MGAEASDQKGLTRHLGERQWSSMIKGAAHDREKQGVLFYGAGHNDKSQVWGEVTTKGTFPTLTKWI